MKEIKKVTRAEKSKHTEGNMNRNFELRDKWLDIKELRQQFAQNLYERSHWMMIKNYAAKKNKLNKQQYS